MGDHESGDESNIESAQVETRAADRRAFMKTAVKTVVAGTAVAGLAASVGRAEAAPLVTAACGGSLAAPKAVVKANVLLNNQAAIKRQDIITLINGLFDGSGCPACGLGGFLNNRDPGVIVEITLGTAFLAADQAAAVVFTEAGLG